MTVTKILTDEQIINVVNSAPFDGIENAGDYPHIIARAIEQAVLQSPEVQVRQWQPIETCPREHGKRYLICKDCGPGTLPSVSVAYVLDGSPEWALDSACRTAEGYGYRVTHWMPLPAPPTDAAMEVKE